MPAHWIRWTEEQEQWLVDNFRGFQTDADIVERFAHRFGVKRSARSLRAKATRLGARSELSYTKEQEEWIRQNFPHMGGVECWQEFNNTFGENRTEKAIISKAHNMKVYATDETVERNKNYPRRVPVGTITDDGYGYLKIKTGEGSSGWVRLHRYLWESNFGKLPKGYKIFFLDGNKRNYRISNMVAVPSGFHAIMNKKGWNCEYRDIAMTGLVWCQLHSALNGRVGMILRPKGEHND